MKKEKKKDKPVMKLKRTFKCQLMFSKQSVKLTQDNCAACFYYLLCHLLFLIANIVGIRVYSILWIFWTCVSLQVFLIVVSLTFMCCRYCHPFDICSLFKFTKYFCSWELSSVNVIFLLIFLLQIFISVFLVNYEWFF